MDKIDILKQIKASKKYKFLDENVIREAIEKFIKKNPKWEEFKDEFILKSIKRELHKQHGSFQNPVNNNKKRKFLEAGDFLNLLKTNKSTQERLEIYSGLYSKIFALTGKPEKIIDLGSGLNVLSYSSLGCFPEYYCYDINKEEKDIVNEFFKVKGIKGRAEVLDLGKIENYKNIEEADICFIFKFLDPIEKAYGKGHKLSEEIVKFLFDNNKCRYIVASFATRTITGKSMKHPYRGWIERMLERINLRFKVLEFENEIFYVIRKS